MLSSSGAVEDLEGIAGGDPALEIDVVAEDAHEVGDGLAGQLVLQRRLVEALVEPDAGAVVILFLVLVACRDLRLGTLVRRRHRYEKAAIVGGGDALDAALAEEDDAHDLLAVARPRPRREEDTHALAFGDGGDLDPRRERRDDAADLVGTGAIGAHDRFDGLALLEDDVAILDGRLGAALLGFGEARDVLGDDPHLDRVEGRIGDAGIAQRVAEAVGLVERARQHLLRRDRHGGAPSGLRRKAPLLLDDGDDVVVGERRRIRLDGKQRQVALDHRDVGVGNLRERLGHEAVAVLLGEEAQAG